MLSTILASLLASAALPPGTCTLIADSTGKILLERGAACTPRTTPASSFKIPLALMGADAGWIEGAHAPLLAYRDSFPAAIPSHRQATDPTRWESESVVWFSQELTRTLGMDKFRTYVERFGYGNRDVSGNPGKADGLTRSWLSNSLAITPAEQIAFLAKVRQRKLGVSDRSYAILDSIVPRFAGPTGWMVAGKTGSGNVDFTSGAAPMGWFVGWLERDGKRPYLFARREIGQVPPGSFGGPAARKSLLDSLGIWLTALERPSP
ncbi:MAG: class D beta-lactamase [Fibrobacteres bacterium]|nr:class D beta-lactamase [Fibrobacterota bacterium]